MSDNAEKVENEPAYVLHRRPFKESSLLIDIFSFNHGRLTLVVNGAHKAKSSKAALAQVFQPLILSWSGRSELKTLRTVEAPSKAFELKGSALYCGYYLNELILYLSPVMEPCQDLFSYYATSLSLLGNDETLMATMRQFEGRLLAEFGLLPDLHRDAQGKELVEDAYYRLNSERQLELSAFVGSGSVEGYTGAALRQLSQLLTCDLSRDQAPRGDRHIAQQLKQFNRNLLDLSLQGRPLKSRDMLLQWYRLRSQRA